MGLLLQSENKYYLYDLDTRRLTAEYAKVPVRSNLPTNAPSSSIAAPTRLASSSERPEKPIISDILEEGTLDMPESPDDATMYIAAPDLSQFSPPKVLNRSPRVMQENTAVTEHRQVATRSDGNSSNERKSVKKIVGQSNQKVAAITGSPSRVDGSNPSPKHKQYIQKIPSTSLMRQVSDLYTSTSADKNNII